MQVQVPVMGSTTSRCPYVALQIAVFLAAVSVAVGVTASCPRHHVCETVQECEDRHGGRAQLDKVLVFICSGERVCCPPVIRKTIKSRRKHRDEETKKRRERNWKLFDVDCGKLSAERVFGYDAAVKPGDYPWMALIGNKAPEPTFLCGGTLISKRYVLTAAHCVVKNDRSPKTDLMVRLGETDTTRDPDCYPTESEEAYQSSRSDEYEETCTVPPKMDFDVEEVIPHELYYPVINDIALLRLDRSITRFSAYVTPICLPWRDYDQMNFMMKGENFTIAGWGLDMNGRQSQVLKTGQVSFVMFDECREFLEYKNLKLRSLPVSKTNTCTEPRTANACMGDSGGPLTTYDKQSDSEVQLGIVSFSSMTACTSQPGDIVVYTKVFAFKNWILDNVREDNPVTLHSSVV